MAIEMVSGDSRIYTATLYMPGNVTFAIDPVADVVKAALVSTDRKTVYAAAITLSSTTTGADWSVSKVAFQFPKAATADIDFSAYKRGEIAMLLEVQVTFNAATTPNDYTWYLEGVTMKKGNIA